eukprot:EG_transcript_4812
MTPRKLIVCLAAFLVLASLSVATWPNVHFVSGGSLASKATVSLVPIPILDVDRSSWISMPVPTVYAEKHLQPKRPETSSLIPALITSGGFLFGSFAFAIWLLLSKIVAQRPAPRWQLVSVAGDTVPEPEEADEAEAEAADYGSVQLEPEAEPFAVEGLDEEGEVSERQWGAFEAEAQRLAQGLVGGAALLADDSIPDELLPKIAIVGVPNVGKSELFNRLTGEAKAVVHNTPGVTRDRMYGRGFWGGRDFVAIDTGGLTQVPEEMSYGLAEAGTKNLPAEIEKQAAIAVDQSDAIVFVVDGQHAPNSSDATIAAWLKQRHGRKPTFLAVNKCESSTTLASAHDFWEYGLEPHAISAKHGSGVADLLDLVVEQLPPPRKPTGAEVSPDSKEIRVAIIGRPNVGKSSILNAIVGEERAVVSDVAGTTRDAVDTLIVGPRNRPIRLVDTAGIRKRSKVGARSNKDTFEHISVASALRAMKKADVVCLVVDASEKVTQQDFRLAELIAQEGRACVIVVNKWDTVKKDGLAQKKLEEDVQACLRPIKWAPVVFASALQKKGIGKILRQAIAVWENHAQRVSTATLNIVVRESFDRNMVSAPSGRRARVYYATQVAVHPPMFLLFVNDVKPFMKKDTYRAFLEKQFREAVGFEGTPLRFLWRASRNATRRSLAPVKPQADPGLVGV